MRSRPLRRQALRIAAVSMAAVGLLLVLLMAGTDLLVARNLTAGVDDRLRDQLQRPTTALPALSGENPGEQDFAEPILRWAVDARGATVALDPTGPTLPASLRSLSGFTTAVIAGTDFRVAGAPQRNGGRAIVAVSLAAVGHAQSTLLVAELIVGPLVLLAVLGGSFLIGRRVAGPIEAMRQRHLDFTADASHELRTPLTVIQAETALLREDAGGELRSSLDRITAETERMRRIVEDLLWLARFDAEPAAPASAPVDLGTVAAVASARFRAVAARRFVGMRLAVSTDGGVVVQAPPEWLDRLVGVLVDNACRHSPPGGEVVVEVTSPGGHPRLCVHDTGPGVPGAERDRLFDRFHRGSDTGEGAGLGLAIADAVVSATAGRWQVSNHRRGGAAFAVVWPRARGVGAGAAGDDSDGEASAPRR